jgi:hypothetical protein
VDRGGAIRPVGGEIQAAVGRVGDLLVHAFHGRGSIRRKCCTSVCQRALEMKEQLVYTGLVIAKKLLTLTLAAGYFFVFNCRLACAVGMSGHYSVAAEHHEAHDDGACHHQEGSKGHPDGRNHPAPCCMDNFDGAPALLPAAVAANDASTLLFILPMAASAVALPLPQFVACGTTRAPPLIDSGISDQSSCGPRAPPSPTAVL